MKRLSLHCNVNKAPFTLTVGEIWKQSLWKQIKYTPEELKTQQLPAILDLWLRKTSPGNSHHGLFRFRLWFVPWPGTLCCVLGQDT